MKATLRVTVFVIGIISIFGFSNLTSAVDYPTRAIDLIVAFSAAGSTTMGARVIAQGASEILGRPVVIVNKTGAGGSIGAHYAAKAKPDGYTLFVFNSASNGTLPAIKSDIPYKNSDFQLIAQYGAQNLAIACKSDAPWKTVNDLIDYAKKNPGELKGGASGVGSQSHFALQLFNSEAGVKITSVPFKGTGESIHALLGGHIQLGVLFSADLKGIYQSGKVRILGTFSSERDPEFPDALTFKEQGLTRCILQSWYGIAAPVGVPKEIVTKLRESFGKTIQTPGVEAMLKRIGFIPVYRDGENFSKFVKDMEEMYFRLAKEGGIKIE
jgi:tripartite-type tricarboxylate transporter receptor subunit TctC